MNLSFEQLKQQLKTPKDVAVANHSPREPGAGGIGKTVELRYQAKQYLVSIDQYYDDGGYGQTTSREDQLFATLEAALLFIRQCGFLESELSF